MGDGLDTGRRGGSLSGGVFSGGPRAPYPGSPATDPDGAYPSFYWAVPLQPADLDLSHPGRVILPRRWDRDRGGLNPDPVYPEGELGVETGGLGRPEDYWVPALACVAYPRTAASPAEPRWSVRAGFGDLHPALPAGSRLRQFWAPPRMEFLLGVSRDPLVSPAGAADDAARTSVSRPGPAAPDLVILSLVGTRPRAAVAQLGDRLLLDWRHP